MMTAYQPQPGGMHPGMPSHGHPGMGPNPGQHMGQPMLHPGVSGPGPHQVSQAQAMMGMQQGANGPMGGLPGGQHGGGAGMGMPGQPGQGMGGQAPNAHALSHLNPQQIMQAQMHSQMHNAQMAMTPADMAARRQAAAYQAAQAGMVPMQQGGMQMNPQQRMQHFQQNNPGMHPGAAGVQLPAHLQQQQIQLHLQQQQRIAAQQNHAQQMQQQMAMQHANSQQSNHGQQGPPSQPSQQGHPPQMRPQSRMANPNEQSQGTPQQPSQPHPQQNQQQPPPQQPQQPGQQQNAQQVPQMTPQQQMHQQHRQLALLQQRQQQINQQRMQAQAQHNAQAQAQQRAGGMCLLRVNLFAEALSNFTVQRGRDLNEWTTFVDRHFHPEGRLLHVFDDNPAGGKPKTYEVLRPTIARYFWNFFESGAQSLRLHVENAKEWPAGNGACQVKCGNATVAVSYPNGARLEMYGSLNALISPAPLDTIECLEIQQTSTEEFISRSDIEKRLNEFSPPVDTKSPKMTKSKLPKAQQKLQQRLDGLTIDHFPKAPKGTMGVISRVQQFLELGETMNVMSELMYFSQEKKLRPDQALEAWVASSDGQQASAQQGNPQINLPPNGVPTGNRTPSMQNMPMPNQHGQYSSPALSNLGLPNGINGSPHIANHPGLQANMNMPPSSHTPSPHQSNMAAPPMVPQHSQQGTNSSAASANTSPNVNNKRRRSTVKMEDDGLEGVPSAPGQQRVKPSPRMSKKAKPGG